MCQEMRNRQNSEMRAAMFEHLLAQDQASRSLKRDHKLKAHLPACVGTISSTVSPQQRNGLKSRHSVETSRARRSPKLESRA